MLSQLKTSYAQRLQTGNIIMSQIAGLYSIGKLSANERNAMVVQVKKGIETNFNGLYAYARTLAQSHPEINIILNTLTKGDI